MKATQQDLKQMAQATLQAKRNGDMRYIDLMLRLSLRTGLDIQTCEAKIEEYANATV
jgi:hypothetical protein